METPQDTRMKIILQNRDCQRQWPQWGSMGPKSNSMVFCSSCYSKCLQSCTKIMNMFLHFSNLFLFYLMATSCLALQDLTLIYYIYYIYIYITQISHTISGFIKMQSCQHSDNSQTSTAGQYINIWGLLTKIPHSLMTLLFYY